MFFEPMQCMSNDSGRVVQGLIPAAETVHVCVLAARNGGGFELVEPGKAEVVVMRSEVELSTSHWYVVAVHVQAVMVALQAQILGRASSLSLRPGHTARVPTSYNFLVCSIQKMAA